MQQAVLVHFPDVDAVYNFTHRDPDVYFTRECYELFVESVKRAFASLSRPHCPLSLTSPVDFDDLRLSKQEREWLAKACPYFKEEYLVYLAQYRFKSDQVIATFHPKKDDPRLGRLQVEVTGPWHETILWEVPLMAVLSEIYFTTADTDWSYDGQEGVYRSSPPSPTVMCAGDIWCCSAILT